MILNSKPMKDIQIAMENNKELHIIASHLTDFSNKRHVFASKKLYSLTDEGKKLLELN